MNKYDFVIFAILVINLIMSFINLIVVDAEIEDLKRWIKDYFGGKNNE
jgi:hypothetical protein